MADIEAVLRNALKRVGAEAGADRARVYRQVRAAVNRRFDSEVPPVPAHQRADRLRDADAAILRIEAEFPDPLPEPVFTTVASGPISGGETTAWDTPRPSAAARAPASLPPPAEVWGAPAIDLAWDEAAKQWRDPGDVGPSPASPAAVPPPTGRSVEARPPPRAPGARPAPRASEPRPTAVAFTRRREPDLPLPPPSPAAARSSVRAEPRLAAPPAGAADTIRPVRGIDPEDGPLGHGSRPIGRLGGIALALLAVAVVGWSAYVFVPRFFTGAEPQSIVTASGETIILFDGTDPFVFASGPDNPIRFQSGEVGGSVQITSSASGGGARATIGPGVAGRLAGRDITVVVEAKGAASLPAETMRVGYQRDDTILSWQTVSLGSVYSALRLVWDIPAGSSSDGDQLLIEPGVPGDGTGADIRAVRIELGNP